MTIEIDETLMEDDKQSMKNMEGGGRTQTRRKDY